MHIPTYPLRSATPLQGSEFLPYVLDRVDAARVRIWASVFIVDARAGKDPFRSVRALIDKLAYAAWRNVDVRVVVGSATIEDIYVACLSSAYYMTQKGIKVRGYASSHGRRSTHSKYLLFDEDLVVVGSSNWSHNAFHQAINSSLAVESDGLAESLSREFRAIWQSSREIAHEG